MNISISQHERLISDLLPQNCKLDDRTEQDMLKFITDISALYNFYDLQNKLDGEWVTFLVRDFSVLVNYIMCTNFSVYESYYQKLVAGLEEKQTDEDLASQLQALITLTHQFLDFFFNLQDRLKSIPQQDEVFVAQLNETAGNFQNLHDQLITLSAEASIIVNRYGGRQQAATNAAAVERTSARVTSARIEIMQFIPGLTRLFHSMHKLYNFLQGLASYYGRNDTQRNGNTEPHIALIKMFVHLYGHLQDKLNQLPVKHLDFYYNTVLDLKYRKAIPDKAFIVAELVAGAKPVTIKEGMLLDATDKATGKKYIYRVTKDQVLTTASIKEIRTLYVSDFVQMRLGDAANSLVIENQVYKGSYSYRHPASFIEPGPSVPAFPVLGEDQHLYSRSERTMQDTEIGFMVSAPILYQRQGRREFSISIYLDNTSGNALQQYFDNYALVAKKIKEEQTHELLRNAFLIAYTVHDGWEPIPHYALRFDSDNNNRNCLVVHFYLDELQKPVDNYQPLVHGYGIETPWPALRFVINNNHFHNAYSYLSRLVIEKIIIRVEVSQFALFAVRNNAGLVSTASPFQPFGVQPVTGAFFDIRNSNVFNKYVRAFELKIHWLDLPEQPGGFERYYEAYSGDYKTSSFVAEVYNANNVNRTVSVTERLFYEQRHEDGNLFVNPVSTLSIEPASINRLSFTNNFVAKEVTPNPAEQEQSGIRIELTQPAGAFGHKQFLKILPEVLVNNSKKASIKQSIPNAPYTPLVKNITAGFVQEQTVYFTTASNANGHSLHFYHLGAFDTGTVFPAESPGTVLLVPRIEEPANLYIGLENCKPEQPLDLFIELANDDFSNAGSHMPTKVYWYFLQPQGWVELDHTNIIEDGTYDLTGSGIIQLRLPFFATAGETAPVQWLRASAYTGLFAHVSGIFTQAFIAERAAGLETVTTGEMVLPSASITSFQEKLPGIKAIWQPFASFGGMPPESNVQYNTRVSEMLWHKNRPMTANDIAKAVLNAFPEILWVKCILPFTMEGNLEYNADLLLLVFPFSNENTGNADEVKVSSGKLSEVRQFVMTVFPFWLNVEVLNPVYEKVKIVCKIRLTGDNDEAMHPQVVEKLHQEIKQYLCPWLFRAGGEQHGKIMTGQTIYQSHLLHFIQSRPYVAYVTSFSLLHLYKEKNATGEIDAIIKDTAVIQQNNPHQPVNDISISASVPYAILVPAQEHNIEIIYDSEEVEPAPTGIAGLSFGSEFVLYYNDETVVVTEDILQMTDDDTYTFHIAADHNNL